MTDHPSYAQPTIVEAVAEIRFVKESFDPAVYGSLLGRLGSEYPNMIPEPLLQSSVEISGSGPAQRIDAGLRARYPQTDGKGALLLSPQAVTLSLNAPYPGWASFLSRMRPAWESVSSVLSPAGVRRLGLRYINRIPWKPGERLADWIAPSGLIPAKLLEQRERFTMRFELTPTPGHRMAVLLADAMSPSAQGEDRWLVLDVDAILEAELAPTFTALEPEFKTLHEHAWEAFSVSCGARLLQHLKGETR